MKKNVSAGDDSSSPMLNLREISKVFRLTHDVTARAMHGEKPFYYRSVASAGALYPFEIYLAAHNIHGLHQGLYYYNLFEFSLSPLRTAPIPELVQTKKRVLAAFFLTGIFFRSAWKYRDRAYRYVLLDTGHLIENLRLALGALNYSFSIHFDFDDEKAATLLGLDPAKEVCLAVIHLHGNDGVENTTEKTQPLEPLDSDILQASSVSNMEVEYAPILQMHQAGSIGLKLTTGDPAAPAFLKKRKPRWIDPGPMDLPDKKDYFHVLTTRRSRRNFIAASVRPEEFYTFFHQIVRSMETGAGILSGSQTCVTIGLLAGEGLPIVPGVHLVDPSSQRLGCVLDGVFLERMAMACLDQMWLKHVAFHLVFLADLACLDRMWGPRGYRVAMMEAGRLGQQAYLAATALGWGACGIGAIYDEEAADLLDLENGEVLLYLIGIGSVKKRRT